MTQLVKQRETDTFMIATIVIDEKIIGWTVTDRQLQRSTDKVFITASMAFEWAELNFKGVC